MTREYPAGWRAGHAAGRAKGRLMGWRRGEVWFDTEVRWFGEKPALAVAGVAAYQPAVPYGLVDSRLRRAKRKHRRRSRRAGAAALVVGSTAFIPLAVQRMNGGAGAATPLAEDPPSLSFSFGLAGLQLAELPL